LGADVNKPNVIAAQNNINASIKISNPVFGQDMGKIKRESA
jgi:hypothetical protein